MPHPLVVNIRNAPCQHYVGHPSIFENPFSNRADTAEEFKVASAAEAVRRYAYWIQTQPGLLARIKTELKGKILGCWCGPNRPCHAEIIAVIANQE